MGTCVITKKYREQYNTEQIKSEPNDVNNGWIAVSQLPCSSLERPILCDNHKLISCPKKFDYNDQKIYTYDSLEDKWKLNNKKYSSYIDYYDDDYTVFPYNVLGIAYNQKKQWLYLYCTEKLILFNLKNSASRDYDPVPRTALNGFCVSAMICANNELHLIGERPYHYPEHLIWNTDTLRYDTIYMFDAWRSSRDSKIILIHQTKKNKLILFGGGYHQPFDSIYIYNLSNNKWSLSHNLFPSNKIVGDFSCALTKNERYLVTMVYNTGNIHTLDLETLHFIDSTIMSPIGPYHLLSMESRYCKQDLMIEGYIRINSYQLMPIDIINVISILYGDRNEFIHFISHSSKGKHLKISVDRILYNDQ